MASLLGNSIFLHPAKALGMQRLRCSHLQGLVSCGHLPLCRCPAGAMLGEYAQATSLIQYLQALQGRRLWANEDVTLTDVRLRSASALAALANAVRAPLAGAACRRRLWAACSS